MRKLLLSKGANFQEQGVSSKTGSGRKAKSAHPKPTLLSSWNVRNDSSNVSAILHADDYLNSPKRTLGAEIKTKPTNQKCCLSTNNCYCREGRIKPKLLRRPEKCPTLEEADKQTRRTPDGLIRTSLRRCLCTTGNSSLKDSLTVEDFEETDKQSAIGLTDQRILYDKYREDECEQLSKEIEKYEKEQRSEDEVQERSTTHSMARGPAKYSGNGSTGYCTDSGDSMDIKDLKNFRDDNYFETHSAGDLGRDIPPHKCVHQFELDERLLPNPINVDVYGRSRCIKCFKTMDDENTSSSLKCSKESLTDFARRYEMGLAPRMVSFAGDKAKIELRLTQQDLERFGQHIGKYRPLRYINSLALRHQKMANWCPPN